MIIKILLWPLKFYIIVSLIVVLFPFYLVLLAVFPKTARKVSLLLIGLWDSTR